VNLLISRSLVAACTFGLNLLLLLASAPVHAEVHNGIDVLRADQFEVLAGKRVGLITNHTGRARDGVSTIELLHRSPKVDLKALFAPEHGIQGVLDESNIPDAVESKTGLRVVSLYQNETRKPTTEQLAGLDILVFDIQDIGARFYTYISTMGLCMEAAAEAGVSFLVLDRLNPINGLAIDGPVAEGERSFTACHPIPIRHGMTVGELARMFAAERKMKIDLKIVPVEGWKRRMYFDQAGLPWVNPSPNMRSLTEAILYPGVALIEFTNVSVGRGTDRPFELVGAPFIDSQAFAAAMNATEIPGVQFDPVSFTPSSSVHAGLRCGGVRIHLKDREALPSVDLGLILAAELRRLYPTTFQFAPFAKLLAHGPTYEMVRDGKPIPQIRKTWEKDLAVFRKRRSSFLLYR